MSNILDQRSSDSPYLETVTRGQMMSDGPQIRPSEVHWHMVFASYHGRVQSVFVGPWTAAGVANWKAGAEILWVKFSLGTFMPHLPVRDFLDVETLLPGAASRSFWLKSSAWQFPDYDNVETFVDRLVHEGVLVHDPVVKAALQDQLPGMPPRTVRHRFLQATGLSQSHILQFERARRAEILLRQGVSILETVFELGYYDQPHLTRSLKRFIGRTPAQIIRLGEAG
jgi:AraC-like DNA-binding protein